MKKLFCIGLALLVPSLGHSSEWFLSQDAQAFLRVNDEGQLCVVRRITKRPHAELLIQIRNPDDTLEVDLVAHYSSFHGYIVFESGYYTYWKSCGEIEGIRLQSMAEHE